MQLISWIIQALQFIILADAILTWIPQVSRRHPVVVALRSITNPILDPIRRAIPPQRTGYIDISPLVAIVGLTVIDMVLRSVIG